MKRASILKILNPILGLLFVNQVATGILHEALPDGAYEIMHAGGGLIFSAIVILHAILNWNWVRANYFKSGSAAIS